MIALKAAIFWCLLFVLAVLNGVARQMVTAEMFGEATALLAHTVFLAALFFVLARGFTRMLGLADFGSRLALGLCLCVATVLAEFALGRALGMTWEQLMADWNLSEGRLWPLVPLALLFGPLFAGPAAAPAKPAARRAPRKKKASGRK